MINNKIDKIKLLTFQILCASLVLILGIYGSLSFIFTHYNTRFYKNITIGDIAVGGKTKEEVTTMIEATYLEPNLDKIISLELEKEQFPLVIQEFIEKSTIEDRIQEAYQYPSTLSYLERIRLLQGKDKKHYDVPFEFNKEKLHLKLAAFLKEKQISSKDAKISITNTGKITIVPHREKISVNEKALFNQIEEYLANPTQLASRTMIPLKDFMIKKEPTITTETLKQVDSLVSSYHTQFVSGTGNSINIKVCAETINGTLLMPGETFSFNDIVGDTTLEKGYTYAPVIAEAKMVEGVGGGVCQVSSTIYNAILKMGLLATERRPHSKPSKYVPLGLDATVSWNQIDFKFENTLDFPMYMLAYTKNNQLYIDVYSNHSLADKTYVLKSEVYKVLPSPVQYKTDSNLPLGMRSLLSPGQSGYKVKAIREVYSKEKLEVAETISWDTYVPMPTVYKVGK